ncbi:uncharacterized protein [Linepithema humile]|uniref:uncharacterized protein isoform X1 n=1 Tax=Linepithema humile TaxID=83485 RepID=UPI0006232C27|nr:PREDICTED: uncharacterized protein LOC105667770 [Linepithema humile]
MRKIAFLVLTLVAIAIADEEEDITDLAEEYETDEKTMRICLDETEINRDEIDAGWKKWAEIINNGNFNEEAKQSVAKLNRFIACLLEQKNMMKNSKLVVSKILQEMVDHNKDKKMPSEQIITECIIDLNKNDAMTKEDRVFGLLVCFVSNYGGKR